jgi:uncharacterized membrane protein
MKKLLLSAVFLLSTLALNAQTTDDMIELIKSDVKTNRKAIITESMAFTEAESKAFWPIYTEFEIELEKLGNKRIQNIKDYAANYESMTNEKADQLMKTAFDFQSSRVKLNESYYKKFAKVLTPITAGKYMQIENQIQLLIDLTVASELPLVKKPVSDAVK